MIKEFYKRSDNRIRLIVRCNHYGNLFSMIVELANTMIADCEDNILRPCEIEIVHYGGDRYKHTFGVEATVNFNPPYDYTEIKSLEMTL